ncbi:MAG: hypothetical protein HY720_09010 [Planctomycetes bacterium]|nr:hypothetical protein [Planctomycetota bacterium]
MKMPKRRDLHAGFEEQVFADDRLDARRCEELQPTRSLKAIAVERVLLGVLPVELRDQVQRELVVALVARRVRPELAAGVEA